MFKINWEKLTADGVNTSLQAALNERFAELKTPDYIAPVSVDDLRFGVRPPVVQLLDVTAPSPDVRARIDMKHSSDDDIQIRLKVQYAGDTSFAIRSALVINFPTPGFAKLPFTLHVSNLHVEGTALVVKGQNALYFSFLDDGSKGPLKDVAVKSDIGDAGKSVLRDAARVEEFIVNSLQTFIKKNFVYPNFHKQRNSSLT